MTSDQLSDRIAKWFTKEVMIHVFLWLLYFIVIAYQKNRVSIQHGGPSYLEPADFVFALNYLVIILIINYYLIPRFFYRKKYIVFFFFSIIILASGILVEEYLLEKLFYPGTRRAASFYGFLPTLLEFGPTIIFFVGFKLAWDNLQKQSDLEKVEKEKTESQLMFLKSQMNPHFLFNNLNNLYSYAQENSPKTLDIIMQLSAIMRYFVYESQANYVPLEKELKYLEDFIMLQELQMESRGQVHYEVIGNVHGQMIAPMMLIAFIENCFKHSLSSQAENIYIEIIAEIQEGNLIFKCANTFSTSNHSANVYLNKGIGLKNVRKRLELQYPNKHVLDIYTKDDIFHVDLRLELQTYAA